MKKSMAIALSLFMVLVLVPMPTTCLDNPSYDPMADVNRDGLVDVSDLQRIGHAYGSTGLIHETGKTVIAVWNETSPIENVRLAIVGSPWANPEGIRVLQVAHTDSSGIADFDLNVNTDYVCLAWSGSRYCYANFTTDEYSEASVRMLLDADRKSLPYRWLVFTIVNKTTGDLVNQSSIDVLYMWSFRYDSASYGLVDDGYFSAALINEIGVCIGWGIDWAGYNLTGRSVVVVAATIYGIWLQPGSCFMTDENGNANVVVYV
jgi:hypothetical protein